MHLNHPLPNHSQRLVVVVLVVLQVHVVVDSVADTEQDEDGSEERGTRSVLALKVPATETTGTLAGGLGALGELGVEFDDRGGTRRGPARGDGGRGGDLGRDETAEGSTTGDGRQHFWVV